MILDGMHPLVRQIPPGSSLSMTAILILGFSRIKTSTKFIAEPEPMIIRSYSSMATPFPHQRCDEKALHNVLRLRATLPGPRRRTRGRPCAMDLSFLPMGVRPMKEDRYPPTLTQAEGVPSMAGKVPHGQVVIRSSHEDLSDPTAHLLMPTVEQGPFLPFERFA